MLNVSAQELESILSTIDKALAMHEIWREQLNRALICKLPPKEDDLAEDAHKRCAFGQWFYASANAKLRNLHSFQKIENMHQAMHSQAWELCSLLKAHLGIGHKEYDAFANVAAMFRADLIKLRQKISETLEKVDPLTGAYRSKFLLPELQADQARKKETGQPYSLLLLRFDLTEYNRQEGHAKGDEVLKEAIQSVRGLLGIEDKIFRFAGAEFVICLPGQDREAANATRARILDALAEAFARVNVNLELSLDIEYGIVELDPDAYIDEVIRRAELAVYTLKI